MQLAPPAYYASVEVCRGIGMKGDDIVDDDDDESAKKDDGKSSSKATSSGSGSGDAKKSKKAAKAANVAQQGEANYIAELRALDRLYGPVDYVAELVALETLYTEGGAAAAVAAGGAASADDDEDDEENDVFNFKGERYMPTRVLAGLMPSALLEVNTFCSFYVFFFLKKTLIIIIIISNINFHQQYNFWQRVGGDLIGEPKSDASADYEIHVKMVQRHRVSITCAEGVCARITRVSVKILGQK